MALGFVRPARPAEADEIARIQLATWRVAYARLLPRHVLDALTVEELAAVWSAAITSPPSPRHRVLVAYEQAEPAPPRADAGATVGGASTPTGSATLVGFAASGPADAEALAPDEPPLGADVAAVTELLVEPRWGRRGHGSRLLAACVDLWRTDEFTRAVAWAYERDPATRKFLGAAGWEPDGAARALDVDDLMVNQLRLHTLL